MKLGTEQEKILKWVNSLEEEIPISPKDGYRKYCEETDYNATKETFHNLLLKLESKGLLEKPEYGKFQVSSKGKSKLRYLERSEEERLSEEQIDKKQQLIEFLEKEKQEEFYQAQSRAERFEVKISEVDKFNPDLVDYLEKNFESFEKIMDEAVEEAKDLDTKIDIKYVFDVEYFKKEIFEARSGENSGHIVTTKGTIESVSQTKNICTRIDFECVECGERQTKSQNGKKKKSPYKCDCGSRQFEVIQEHYIDSLEFVLSKEREQNEKITCRYQSEGLDTETKEVLNPGNKVRVSGVVEIQAFSEKKNAQGRPVLYAKGLRQKDKSKNLDDFSSEKVEEVRSKVKGRTNPFKDFAHSLAPKIVDEEDMKEVISAGLFGGSSKRDDGRIHVCIFSNPGRGKSDVQEFNEETFPNTHYADGKQASGVGLTATVEQEKGGRWRLKAGKLVYADKGVLCIDEFDKMDHDDASRLNTAMQKPTFPVDKAGVNARLPGEATVIATGNFNSYVDDESVDFIREYIPDHAESLMDRFSLVYALTGDNDSSRVSEAILNSFGERAGKDVDTVFDEEELLIYRELARSIDPVLTEVSKEYLMDWLESQKTISDSKDSSFQKDSKRYLVSLAKLTTMFARTRLSKRTNERDAESAIELMVKCRESRGVGDGESGLSDFNNLSDRRKWKMIREKTKELLDRRDDEVMYDDIADNLPEGFTGDLVERLIKENGENEFHEPRGGVVQKL